jgi:predicted AAA+ superfamily ATPase
MYPRLLNLAAALDKKSHFLLGPRATGKSWLIRHQLQNAQIFDLLDNDTFERFLKRPAALGEEIHSQRVVIDEIQKLPKLLDEVHRLIEHKQIHFLLTGSSARKLKHGGANLLGGRARSLELFPLTSQEIPSFDLNRYCSTGGLPSIYPSDDYWSDLKAYVQLYLKEEIIAEAVVRKVDHYAKFLDAIGYRSGEVLNFQQIASDSGVPVRTVDHFVEILKDTLLAFELAPFQKTKIKKSITKKKIYLFDLGVANFLAGRKNMIPRSEAFGKAFEHWIIQEIRAYLGYQHSELPLMYWRTQGESHEVDCIIGDEVAIEIKSSETYQEKMLSGLKALQKEKKIKKFILVTRDPVQRTVDQIEIMPCDQFLKRLWKNEIVT